MTLEKLTIQVETSPGRFTENIRVLFNPKELTINKVVQWQTTPRAQSDTGDTHFATGQPATLDVTLYCDTYEEQRDVRDFTQQIFRLTTVIGHGEIHRPPLVRLLWGRFNISDSYSSNWVLTNLRETYTLFLPDGTPVRATLVCTFKQWQDAERERQQQNLQSSDVVKTHLVKRGDTLSNLAALYFNDPALWRPIAQANAITNPRSLTPGQVLVIPTLPPGNRSQR